jgi:hypothetical protein
VGVGLALLAAVGLGGPGAGAQTTATPPAQLGQGLEPTGRLSAASPYEIGSPLVRTPGDRPGVQFVGHGTAADSVERFTWPDSGAATMPQRDVTDPSPSILRGAHELGLPLVQDRAVLTTVPDGAGQGDGVQLVRPRSSDPDGAGVAQLAGLGAPSGPVVVADLDGDGRRDAAVARRRVDGSLAQRPAGMEVVWGPDLTSPQTLPPRVAVPSLETGNGAAVAADVRAGGGEELVVAGNDADGQLTLWVAAGGGRSLSVQQAAVRADGQPITGATVRDVEVRRGPAGAEAVVATTDRVLAVGLAGGTPGAARVVVDLRSDSGAAVLDTIVCDLDGDGEQDLVLLRRVGDTVQRSAFAVVEGRDVQISGWYADPTRTDGLSIVTSASAVPAQQRSGERPVQAGGGALRSPDASGVAWPSGGPNLGPLGDGVLLAGIAPTGQSVTGRTLTQLNSLAEARSVSARQADPARDADVGGATQGDLVLARLEQAGASTLRAPSYVVRSAQTGSGPIRIRSLLDTEPGFGPEVLLTATQVGPDPQSTAGADNRLTFLVEVRRVGSSAVYDTAAKCLQEPWQASGSALVPRPRTATIEAAGRIVAHAALDGSGDIVLPAAFDVLRAAGVSSVTGMATVMAPMTAGADADWVPDGAGLADDGVGNGARDCTTGGQPGLRIDWQRQVTAGVVAPTASASVTRPPAAIGQTAEITLRITNPGSATTSYKATADLDGDGAITGAEAFDVIDVGAGQTREVLRTTRATTAADAGASFPVAISVRTVQGAEAAPLRVDVAGVNAAPVVDFSFAPQRVLAGTSRVTFDATQATTDDGDTDRFQRWEWSIDGTSVQRRTNVTAAQGGILADRVFEQARTYRVRLEVTDALGATASRQRDVTVVPDPDDRAPSAALTVTPDPAFAGRELRLDAGSSTGTARPLRFRWDTDGVPGTYEQATTEPTLALTPDAAGPRTFGVEVTDARGRTSMASATVTVLGPPTAAPVARFELPDELEVADDRTTLTLDASASAGRNDPDRRIVAFAWDLDGDGTFETDRGTDPTVALLLDRSGPRAVGLRVTDAYGNTATASRTIVVRRRADQLAGCPEGESVTDEQLGALRVGGCWRVELRAGSRPRLVGTGERVVHGLHLVPAGGAPAGAAVTVDLQTGRVSTSARYTPRLRNRDTGYDMPVAVPQVLDFQAPAKAGDRWPFDAVAVVNSVKGLNLVGFPIAEFSVLAEEDGTLLKAGVSLPEILGFATGQTELRAPLSGEAELAAVEIAIGSAFLSSESGTGTSNASSVLSGFAVQDIRLRYEQPTSGGFRVVGVASFRLPFGADGQDVPELGVKLGFTQGALEQFDFNAEGINRPLGSTPIFLQRIRGGIGLRDGLRLTGGVGASFGPKLGGQTPRVDGDFTILFPNRTWSAPIFDVRGRLTATPLDSVDGYVSASTTWGAFGLGYTKEVEVRGWRFFRVRAELDGLITARDFQLEGGGSVGVYLDGRSETKLASARLSAGTAGIGACGQLLALEGGFFWDYSGSPDVFTGCRLDDYRVPRPPGLDALREALEQAEISRAPAGGRRQVAFAVDSGEAQVGVKVFGRGGIPDVELIDPAGRRYAAPAGQGRVGRGFAIARSAPTGETAFLIARPRPGAWRVVARGDSRIARVRVAGALPDPRLRARLVRRRGGGRAVRFAVRPDDRQRVVIVERAGRLVREVARTRRSRGTIPVAFGPATARRRTFEVRLLRRGRLRATRIAGRARAPRGGPQVRDLRLRRRPGARLRVTFRPPAGVRADAFRVLVQTGGTRRSLLTRRRTLTLGGIAARGRVRVSVAPEIRGTPGGLRTVVLGR